MIWIVTGVDGEEVSVKAVSVVTEVDGDGG